MTKRMKHLIFISLIIFFGKLNLTSQNSLHPTIDTLEVTYMGAQNDQVIAEAIIHLKQNVQIAKIYCKIIDPTNNNIVYDINYSVSSMPVSGSNGITLCLKNNSVIQILSANSMELKSYTYQIKTEDNQGNISLVYSLTKDLEP